ncbi:unnamed protein product, partial [Sphacelaria rigidula]
VSSAQPQCPAARPWESLALVELQVKGRLGTLRAHAANQILPNMIHAWLQRPSVRLRDSCEHPTARQGRSGR